VESNILDIILVEDSPYDVDLTLEALKEINLANRIKVLKDGEEAVKYIFRQGEFSDCGICEHPSLILLDIRLPKIDGLEILRRIKTNERTRGIPVVVITGSENDEVRNECYQLGANSLILKPLEPSAFTKVVAQIGLYWAILNQPPY
jgi:two-component system, response regulator